MTSTSTGGMKGSTGGHRNLCSLRTLQEVSAVRLQLGVRKVNPFPVLQRCVRQTNRHSRYMASSGADFFCSQRNFNGQTPSTSSSQTISHFCEPPPITARPSSDLEDHANSPAASSRAYFFLIDDKRPLFDALRLGPSWTTMS